MRRRVTPGRSIFQTDAESWAGNSPSRELRPTGSLVDVDLDLVGDVDVGVLASKAELVAEEE